MSGKQWFAVRCKPRREVEARAEFERQGFEVWLPMELRLVRHARRMEKRPWPFFPGYLFLRLGPEERRWTAIRSTRGAIEAVHFGAHYPPVPDEVVARLRAMEDEAGFIRMDGQEASAPFRPGARVRVQGGAMAGLEGVLLTCEGEQRALVLLEMLQRQVKARLPLAELAAA